MGRVLPEAPSNNGSRATCMAADWRAAMLWKGGPGTGECQAGLSDGAEWQRSGVGPGQVG